MNLPSFMFVPQPNLLFNSEAVRLDAEILELFKSLGAGYRSRINAALRMEVVRNLTSFPRSISRKRVAV